MLLDLGTGKLIVPATGGVQITLPKGSEVLDMHLSRSGHWMLPMTHYELLKSDKSKSHKGDSDPRLSFAVE